MKKYANEFEVRIYSCDLWGYFQSGVAEEEVHSCVGSRGRNSRCDKPSSKSVPRLIIKCGKIQGTVKRNSYLYKEDEKVQSK